MVARRGVEQRSARRAHNPEVVSSNLTSATIAMAAYDSTHMVTCLGDCLPIMPMDIGVLGEIPDNLHLEAH